MAQIRSRPPPAPAADAAGRAPRYRTHPQARGPPVARQRRREPPPPVRRRPPCRRAFSAALRLRPARLRALTHARSRRRPPHQSRAPSPPFPPARQLCASPAASARDRPPPAGRPPGQSPSAGTWPAPRSRTTRIPGVGAHRPRESPPAPAQAFALPAPGSAPAHPADPRPAEQPHHVCL